MKIALPQRTTNRLNLMRSAAIITKMRSSHDEKTEAESAKAELAQVKAELATVKAEAARRAHREDRLAAITIREVDNRPAWAAKMGLKRAQRQPMIALASTMVIVADVWVTPTED